MSIVNLDMIEKNMLEI